MFHILLRVLGVFILALLWYNNWAHPMLEDVEHILKYQSYIEARIDENFIAPIALHHVGKHAIEGLSKTINHTLQ